MRNINEIILHCSATKEGEDVTIEEIDRWHRERGFRACGYHYVIYRDGTVRSGRALSQVGAHTIGHNTNSIVICYIGGLDSNGCPKDTRTDQQRDVMFALCKVLLKQFPNATIHGHNEYANKACPCFDVAEFTRELFSDKAEPADPRENNSADGHDLSE